VLDLDAIPPASEHLVIDADPSQQQAIAAVLSGSNLILQGPPGTGKSQTIANLIAEAAATGQQCSLWHKSEQQSTQSSKIYSAKDSPIWCSISTIRKLNEK
jgi:superfamily II DNA/RNA helicase